jgi:hypothetical protein
MNAEMIMYMAINDFNHGKTERVIVFCGFLAGKMAVYESEMDNWKKAFELARQLGIEIRKGFSYEGSIAQ